MVRYLQLEEVLAIRDSIMEETGGRKGILDFTLLHSAVERPKATFAGQDLYPTIFDKTAALIHSLILNHPFNDGNKRTGLAIAVRFLYINGYRLKYSERLAEFTLDIQKHRINLEEISIYLEKHSKII